MGARLLSPWLVVLFSAVVLVCCGGFAYAVVQNVGDVEHLPLVATLPEIGTRRIMVERAGIVGGSWCTQLTVPGFTPAIPHLPLPISLSPSRGVRVTPGCFLGGPTGLDDIRVSYFTAADTGIAVLWGLVGSGIVSVELVFQDGSRVDIPVRDGLYVIYEINPTSYAYGHQPTTIVARDASGRTLKRPLGPFGGKRVIELISSR